MAVGTDATHPATNQLIGLATSLLGSKPLFFGRYFKGPHNPSPIQYQGNQENPVLSASNIRVLCVARQTTRVGGSAADGVADAVNNMAAVVDAFGAAYLDSLDFEPLIFLDTELSPSQPTLSAEYYSGWSGALRKQGPIAPGVRLQFTPGVYINRSDNASWRALATAVGKGGMLAAGDLTKLEFTALVDSQKGLATLDALTHLGISAATLQRFRDGLVELVINTAFKVFLPM